MPRPSFGALLQTTAVSVATILGSGILGLPVSLYRSGIPPFIMSFTCTLIAQLGVVYAGCELLQRAQVDLHEKHIMAAGAWESLPYGLGEIDPLTSLDEPRDGLGTGEQAIGPSLHTFAELYLPLLSLKILFESAVMLHFISIMSSYALGAPQAFESVFPHAFNASPWILIVGFSTIASLAVIMFADAIVLPLTVATFFKGGLLTAVVLWILGIGIKVDLKPSTDWSAAAGIEPYLMGSLALAGCINLMPKLWEICLRSTGLPDIQGMDKEFVSWFRASVNIAVVLCYILNVLWCIGVLMIVPQTSPTSTRLTIARMVDTLSPGLLGFFARTVEASNATIVNVPKANVTSLAHANLLGEISTIPLVEVLKNHSGGSASTIFNLINLFVFVSITVSFLVVGIGMKHMLDDLAGSAIEWVHRHPTAASPTVRQLRRQKGTLRVIFNVLSFGIVTIIAVSNPRLLLKIMAGVTSLCVNAEGGLLIMTMLYVARKKHADEGNLKPIPAAMGNVFTVLVLSVGFGYYIFVILLDVVKYLPSLFR